MTSAEPVQVSEQRRDSSGACAVVAECEPVAHAHSLCMQIGDNVRVRASGRRARIIEDHGHSRYRVLFYSEPAEDPLDSATVEDEDDAGGVYEAGDLEVIL